jgi:hypothetical protein
MSLNVDFERAAKPVELSHSSSFVCFSMIGFCICLSHAMMMCMLQPDLAWVNIYL